MTATTKVSQDDCDRRHRALRRLAVTVAVLVSLAIGLPLYAWQRAADVDTRLQVHQAAQNERDDAIANTLGELKTGQKEILKVVNGK